LFFFSSRRRHTRWPRDWSSDVCSSDLKVATLLFQWTKAGKIQLHLARIRRQKLRDEFCHRAGEVPHDRVHALAVRRIVVHALERSEERRVGKECRWWSWSEQGTERV